MLSVVSLLGRPNVGKSTLFNRLTGSRNALVDDQPGVTRDRQYGRCQLGDVPFLVVDTGGMESSKSALSEAIHEQIHGVLAESALVLFMVDARAGVVYEDRDIAHQLRLAGTPTLLVVNKAEGVDAPSAVAGFHELGLGQPVAVSAKRGDGMANLLAALTPGITPPDDPADSSMQRPAVVLAGRPNVGKSTLTNRLARQNRVIVSDQPGTTRDSIRVPLAMHDFAFDLIDTAGVRKKARVKQAIEKYSVVKTLQAIESSQVVLLLLDAVAGVQAQDAAIAGIAEEFGRSIVIVVNKWDRLPGARRKQVLRELDHKLAFLPNPEVVPISALHGSRVNEVIPAARRAYQSAMADLGTYELNRTLANAIIQTPPPAHNKRPIRLKYAHQGGRCPPTIIVHGNRSEALPQSYRRYLARYFARAHGLVGTRVRIVPRNGRNPFQRGRAATPGRA